MCSKEQGYYQSQILPEQRALCIKAEQLRLLYLDKVDEMWASFAPVILQIEDELGLAAASRYVEENIPAVLASEYFQRRHTWR